MNYSNSRGVFCELDWFQRLLPFKKTTTEIETFTIDLSSIVNGTNINFSWDDVLFSVPVTME
ncbi:hypothetical protein C9994_09775 [Marivirga lumbricoides]|uniref:Uncharacterized protein n=1 Tax=Marivirga lumbricoides TaxID=1046115 RepID=A0A2T4DPY7_9BACT|nr:hypothetical protein C9994_09775 [Marivirga lumbricoides]